MEIEKWLDNSKASAFERCPREFLLRYVLHLSQPHEAGSVALAFGKSFHKALEVFFAEHFQQKLPFQEALETCKATAMQLLNEQLTELAEQGSEELYTDPRADVDFLVRAIDYFLTQGTGADLVSMTKSCLTELKMELKLPLGAWSVLARADLIIRTHGDQNLLIDFKTTRWSINAPYWSLRAQADTQLSTYGWVSAATAVVDRVHASAYAVCRADRRKLKNGQWSPNIALESAMFPVALTTDMIKRAEARFIQIVKRLDTLEVCPANFPCIFSSCLRMNRLCQFFPLCELTWSSSSIDELLETADRLGYISKPWHPFQDD